MPVSPLVMVLSVVAFSLLTAWLLQRRGCRRLKVQVAQLEIQLQESQQETSRPSERFSEDLVVAERNRQEPVTVDQEMPDRYRYIRGMARQGMNAAQIATILQVGEEEAAQIVRLARLKRDL